MSLYATNRLAAEADVEHQFRSHAPLDRFDPTRTNVSPEIRKAISETAPVEAIVLTVDIRRSSAVLKESIDIPQYARTLDDFIGEFRTVLHYHGGWFEKFTGDGFICYWLLDKEFAETMDMVLDFCCSVMDNFRSYYYPAFVANMRNEPIGIGLAIGIDAGPCYLTPIVGDLTIIGSPIVGSVRMCEACPPYHLMLNAYPGSRLVEGMATACGRLSDTLTYEIGPRTVATKEYADGQMAYGVELLPQWAAPVPLNYRARNSTKRRRRATVKMRHPDFPCFHAHFHKIRRGNRRNARRLPPRWRGARLHRTLRQARHYAPRRWTGFVTTTWSMYRAAFPPR